MVKPTEHGCRDDIAIGLDTTTDGGVTLQRLMCSRLVVVAHVLDEGLEQVRLTKR